jgi:hypothetical protein
LALSVDEFLCRFLLHILPQGFVRIRHFGFLANRRRTMLLPLCFQLLGSAQQLQTEQHVASTEDAPGLWRCPKCGGPMKVVEHLTAVEIQLRSPHGSALRHETTLSNSEALRPSGRSVSLWLAVKPIPSSGFFDHSLRDTFSP